MAYKVFLVEDEIVAREGIRDNVDWRALGFIFCGEAPDGEIALPLIEAARPDVLITDIKMPFMDGLQLSRLVKERLPAVKIIILSGHDEFHYAQEAIKLGVTEYLLKPVGVRDLHGLLERVATQLTYERSREESLQQLKNEVGINLALLRERFLLRLLTVGATPAEAIEESRRLELELVAVCYQVIVVKVEPAGQARTVDYAALEQAYAIVDRTAVDVAGSLLLKKDLDEFVLVLKGESPQQLADRGGQFVERIRQQVDGQLACHLRFGIGTTQQRVGELHFSFSAALLQLQDELKLDIRRAVDHEAARAELLLLDKGAVEEHLKFGTDGNFDQVFDAYIGSLSASTLDSYLIRTYLSIDISVLAAKYIHQLGGNIEQVFPEINRPAKPVRDGDNVEQLREHARATCMRALAFRDRMANHRNASIVQRARDYIDLHYAASDLSLNDVAAHVNLSPSHFSTVFSNEAGETFKEYLTRLRIDKAKELLRATSLTAAEICDRIGYNDPHYFSAAFKKATGLSPRQFRSPTEIDHED